VVFRPEKYREEFRYLAARAHYQRVWPIELVDAFKRLVAASVEAAGARHPEPAPFALDGVQAPDILPNPLPVRPALALCFLHARKLPTGAGNRCLRQLVSWPWAQRQGCSWFESDGRTRFN
jgi:hypothetical protein